MANLDTAIAEYAVTHFLHLVDGYRRQEDAKLLSPGKPSARSDWAVNEFIFFEPPWQPNDKYSAARENHATLRRVVSASDDPADALRSDGALLLKWYGLRDTFDGYLRDRLLAWTRFCRLRIERERWVAPNWAELWLVADGEPGFISTIADAERLIAHLIELHGGPPATVTLTPRAVATWGYSASKPRPPTRETPWFALETASLEITFDQPSAPIPRAHPDRIPRLVQSVL